MLTNKTQHTSEKNSVGEANDMQGLQEILMNAINKKDSKKGYESYGIISEIMPFSDKR